MTLEQEKSNKFLSEQEKQKQKHKTIKPIQSIQNNKLQQSQTISKF